MDERFGLMQRLARWQLDCPVLLDPVLGARAARAGQTEPGEEASADPEALELERVAIVSEN